MKIASVQVENTKRVKAVRMQVSPTGLTVIGGKNKSGKTSILNAIAWCLGGNRMAPSNPQREGSLNPPFVRVVLDNGIIVERKGKSSALHVTDPSGQRAGQALLDSFVSQFALDLPRFLNGNNRDKADTLLGIIGIGDELKALEQNEARIYQERLTIGQIADSKKKHAAELPEYADAPGEAISALELIQQQQAILSKNGKNQALRAQHAELRDQAVVLQTQIDQLQARLKATLDNLAIAAKSVENINDESTVELELSLANIEVINSQVAANQAKAKATDEAAEYKSQYDAKTHLLEKVRADRMRLLEEADLPLPGLSVVGGELLLDGKGWDCISGSEQLKVTTAIVRRLNPNCGFVLMDRFEQFDQESLKDFDQWLESQNLQVIATRVSTGGECSIIIEDGLPQGSSYVEVITETEPEAAETKWGFD